MLHKWTTRRGWAQRLAGLAGLATVFGFIASCEREKREFQAPAPAANVTRVVRLSTLQPGEHEPEVTVKNAYEQNAFAMSEGKTLFSSFNCTGCHAHGGGDIGPPLMDDRWVYGSDPGQIYLTIVQGRPNGMPSFGGKLTEDQVWKLVAYVRSMSGLVRFDAAPGREDHMQTTKPENSVDRQEPKDYPGTPAGGQRPE
jgi:cytochrome c oxidase cbb3-type subunit 3